MPGAVPSCCLLGVDLSGLTPLEWAVVGVSVVAVIWVIVAAVKMTLHPGEEEPDHVKRVIFQEPKDPTGRPPEAR